LTLCSWSNLVSRQDAVTVPILLPECRFTAAPFPEGNLAVVVRIHCLKPHLALCLRLTDTGERKRYRCQADF
jgi:hypothetical protein